MWLVTGLLVAKLVELLSQMIFACRLLGPQIPDSRDCHDKRALDFQGLFTEWKSGYFEGKYSSFCKLMIEKSQI